MTLDLTGYKKFEQDQRLVKRILFLEQEWQRACPSVNLQDQLGWAHYWLCTNSKGAHYRDMTRFLSNWFKRCQIDLERSNNSDSPIQMPKPYKEERPRDEDIMQAEDFAKMKEALNSPKKPALEVI